MKKVILFLFISGLIVPTFAQALKKEPSTELNTLAERKQRIMRKYLSSKVTMEQSNLLIPLEVPTEEESTIWVDERSMQAGIDRNEIRPMPPPPPMRRIAADKERNWLLNAEDPMSEEESEEKKSNLWEKYFDEVTPQYGQDNDNLYGSEYSPRNNDPKRPSPYELDNRGGKQEPEFENRRPTFFQPQQERGFNPINQQQDPNSGSRGQSGGVNNRSNPYPSRSIESENKAPKLPIQTPYKSPYETKKPQQQQSVTPYKTEQNYVKPNAFEEWKKRNVKPYDPNKP